MVQGMKTPAPSLQGRQPWLDAMRGLAMLWMTGFHFCFDLSHFGYWQQHFLSDPFWLTQRTLIVSLFLCCAGWAQALAVVHGQGWARFWRRWSQVALCALAVTAGSWWMFPGSYISFGVLHGVAVMLLLVRTGVALGGARVHLGWLGALALLCLILPGLLVPQIPVPWVEAFNGRLLNWLGLVTQKPFTQDYVPVLPWLGVLLLGFVAGLWTERRREPSPGRRLPRVLMPLATLGRWSLSYYMLHQPVLMGLLLAFGAWRSA